MDDYKWNDILLQAAIIVIVLFAFLFLYNLPQRLFSALRLRLHLRFRRSRIQANRHFVLAAQLFAQAKSSSDPSLAARAVEEADRAIALDPRDAAAHILKALALDLQGYRSSALDSIDAAFSPLAVGSLSDDERGEALLKRAELRAAAADRGGVAEDVAESARLIGKTPRGLGILGNWYEKKGQKDEARQAYRDAIQIRPDYGPALNGLARLNS